MQFEFIHAWAYFCFCYSANEITSLFSKHNHLNALYECSSNEILKIYHIFLVF